MFELSKDHEDFRRVVREFAEAEVAPHAADWDRRAHFPVELVPKMGDLGLFALVAPEELGGHGGDFTSLCVAIEELGRVDQSVGITLSAGVGLGINPILAFGSAEQKERWLPDLLAGRALAAFGLTEPEAGSDAAAIRTRAERVEGGWRSNGRKHWISGGHAADVVMVMAVTDPAKRARGGIGAFLVERGTPGFEVTRIDTTIGSEAIKLGELTFTDCVVPDEALLGGPGDGFAIAMGSLTSGRLGVSAACIGTADRLNAMATEHAKQRSTFGQKLADRQAIQWMLADSATEIEVARAFLYDTLRRIAAGQDPGVATAMCKLFCSEMVGRVADRSVQIHGGMGLMRGYPVERFYRDIRHYRVGEGASEIQRMLIARDLLK